MQNQTIDVAGGCRATGDGLLWIRWPKVRPTALFYRRFFNVFTTGTGTLLSLPVSAAALPTGSGTDGVLSGLPGVLIAGLALVFAIRERSRSKQLRLALAQRPPAAPERQTAAASYSAVALWQTDGQGNTIYANKAMCLLLGVGDVETLRQIRAETLLQPLNDDVAGPAGSDKDKTYGAVLRPLDTERESTVIVFEQRVADGDDVTITRTVIDPNTLPRDLIDRCRRDLTAVA